VFVDRAMEANLHAAGKAATRVSFVNLDHPRQVAQPQRAREEKAAAYTRRKAAAKLAAACGTGGEKTTPRVTNPKPSRKKYVGTHRTDSWSPPSSYILPQMPGHAYLAMLHIS
jgi:hypothetical protein